MKTKKGFTLIEMLIVVAIIGIIAAIALASVTRARKRAVGTRGKAAMTEMAKGMEMAASEGCRAVDFNGGAAEATLTCNGKEVTYVTIPGAPGGMAYSVTIDSSTVESDGIGSNGNWGASLTNKSTSSTYSFEASGFEGEDTFTCDTQGCRCSDPNGCAAAQ